MDDTKVYIITFYFFISFLAQTSFMDTLVFFVYIIEYSRRT